MPINRTLKLHQEYSGICDFKPSRLTMYYRPKLANGKIVVPPWPLYVYRLLNNICWPLEDNAGLVAWLFDRIIYVGGVLIFIGHNEAEFRYLHGNLDKIDDLLTGMPTFLVLIEIFFRCFPLGLRKEKLKLLLKEFYAEIYIDKAEYPENFRRIQEKLRLTSIVSGLYFSTLGLYLFVTVRNAIYNIREPLYKMSFAFDHTPLHIFYPIVLANLWVGLIVVSTMIGELNIISEILLHLNRRFRFLRKDIRSCAKNLLKEADPACMAKEFQMELCNVIARSVKLYQFADKVRSEFSFRIFIWFAFSAGLLCVLGFKVYTNPKEGIVFACWCCGKILELITIGELGSTLIRTTDEVSLMYYESHWELIIERSSNTRENVRLMRLLLIAMETSHKPICLTGLNFFNVSLSSVIKILRGAGSYFTCLISLR